MLSLGIKGSCFFLHYARGMCGGTKGALCLGHTFVSSGPAHALQLIKLCVRLLQCNCLVCKYFDFYICVIKESMGP